MKSDFVENFVVGHNAQIKLSKWDPDFTGGIYKNYAENLSNNDFMNQMSTLQYKLFANKNQSLFVIL